MRRWMMIPISLAAAAGLLLTACSSANYGSASPQASSSAAAASAAPATGKYEMAAAPPGLAGENNYGYEDAMMDEAAYESYEELGYADAPMQATENPKDTGGIAEPQLQNRKLVKYSDLILQTKEFDKAVEGLTALVLQAGGYIESQSIQGSDINWAGGYRERNATINARVPSDKLDETINALGGVCHVVTHNQRMEDISETYFDSQARLKSLNQQETQLLEILSKAEKLEDVVSLQQALGDVRYQIESITASLRRMDSQVSYSYLSMSLQEVMEYQTIQETPKSFSEQLAAAFGRSGKMLSDQIRYSLLSIVEYGPSFLVGLIWTLLCWGLCIWVILWAVRAALRRFGVNNRFTRKWEKRSKRKKDVPQDEAVALPPDAPQEEKES